MTKKIILALSGILIIAGSLAGIKVLQIRTMMSTGSEFKMPPTTVNTVVAMRDNWAATLRSVGSLSAVQGVTVAAELAGKITRIAFQAGSDVQAGDLLVQQDVSTEQAQLPGAEAEVELTRLNLERISDLLAKQYISQAEYDAAAAAFRQAQAAVERIKADIAKKTIRAPFSGKLGIRLVNLGQILDPGQEIVSLQALNPLFVEFLLPQQRLAEVKTGMSVRLTG
ncbi:MAG TPA: efflux RND transporter periplasmic adaptor subunit, partial [Geothermobacteraceae bacterium]|nr:efflux RND transporter periplasmic adaptor subunit [Geothermobacteraceae bacterium]